ncbi:outer membrane receptor protein [Flavobacterium enshiense DK69]|uniref:TonB-dependent receptor n=1 Tax=Flavobacterium enshiense DK69 TaxID=1107311 RepID=V6SJ72_9FLAO|nr:TonB-dependent receptor [Flavobacterium enshiense]ESU24480.1 outer membrane receptor protein [Flavobacterium enshiense DK69]KGO93863.1 TonB-dependent receptor [Flavobacterium enshiense DK69]
MKLNFLVTTLLFTVFAFAQKGTVTGSITDKDMNNEALPFATVMIKGTTNGVNTDEQGHYSLSVSEGSHVLQISFLGYESVEIPFTIKSGETKTINQALGAKGVELQDVVIKVDQNREKETALLVEQKKAVEIKQSIGAQELSRKGVSDVEEGLTKMTGISKVGSRGLFVRGLEDRYNNLLINNLAVPSNNPFKKIIPLDLIPTDVVSVIETFKTFNPNIYGDFAGATFNIATSKANNSITKLSLGAGLATNNNLRNFHITSDADNAKGFFGLTGNDRALPSEFSDNPFPPATLSGQNAVDAFKTGFEIKKTKSPLNTSVGILHAEKFNLKNSNKISYLLSLNFDNSFQYRTGVDRTLNPGDLIQYSNNFTTTTYNYKTNFSSIVGVNYSSERLNLSTNVLYLKTSENLIQDQLGYQNAQQEVNDYLIRTNQLDETNYLNGQLFGDYALTSDKNHLVKMGISLAKTAYDQPDRNSYTGHQLAEDNVLVSYGGNNFLRQYLDVKNDVFSSAFLEYNFKFGKEHKLSVGYNGNTNSTESSYRFIQTISPNNVTFNLNPFTVNEQIETDLLNNVISYQESSNANWKAKLEENNNAGYANLFYKFSEKFDVNAGFRAENFDRTTKYKGIGSFDQPYITVNTNKMYFLPSVNAKYGLNEDMNLRFAASQTYSKPVILESYPLQLVNPDNTVFQGNPYLVNSDNTNIDLKFEMFPTSKEMFAVGVFGKNIKNPIERSYLTSPGSTITTFLNSDNAKLYGLEAEFILDLERVSPTFKDLSWGFNTSLMHTKVTVSDVVTSPNGTPIVNIETHKDRELQGASKWLINSDLKYQFNMSNTWTNTLSVVYSVFGKRIYSVGTAGLDHIYELPVSRLDLVLNSKLSKHFDLKLSADNILNPQTKFELGRENTTTFNEASYLMRNYKKGVGFSFNLGYTF